MRLFTAVIIVFTLVCSGSFGMEDVVSSSGAGLTLLMIIVLPFLWSIPMALVASELGSAIPEAGGFYRWVRRAMPGASGEYWSFQTGWWWTLSLYVDSAVYVALATTYIQSKVGAQHMTTNWRWLLGIGIVGIVTFINVRGLELTGRALTVIQIVVLVPFVGLVIWGFAKGNGSAVSPFLPPGTSFWAGTSAGLAIMMWMYSGYESMSTLAAEVENPQRLIPRAIMVAVPIVIFTYAITVAAGIVAAGHGNWANMVSDSSQGGISFVDAAKSVGGATLAWAVLVSAIASNIGLYTGYLATGSRPSYALSRDRLFPHFLGKAHRSWGTPWVAILIMGVVDAILVRLTFVNLIVIDVFLLMLSYIPILITGVVLRIREPNLPRPFRVPLPTWGLAVYIVIPIAIAIYALFTNGADYLTGGLIAVLSGPVAYLLFKVVYKGTADAALEHAVLDEGPIVVNDAEPVGEPAPVTL
jgi:amino acid transporter